MRNGLPKTAHRIECGILNLDTNDGTHWTCWIKKNGQVLYFDSFGNLRPPIELVLYLKSSGPCEIQYNHRRFQNFNALNCGHLVLNFLYQNTKPFSL